MSAKRAVIPTSTARGRFHSLERSGELPNESVVAQHGPGPVQILQIPAAKRPLNKDSLSRPAA